MNEPDDVLRELLRRWEAPKASAQLNARVLRSYRRSVRQPWTWYAPLRSWGKNARKRARQTEASAPPLLWWLGRFRLLAAAALVLAAGVWWLRPTPTPEMESGVSTTREGVTYATTLNLTGFQPIRDGKIITLQKGEKP